MTKGWLSATFALLVWGVTFASTRALLFDFSALEIMVARFVMAWAVLRGMERVARWSTPTMRSRRGWRDEYLYLAMGLTGVCW